MSYGMRLNEGKPVDMPGPRTLEENMMADGFWESFYYEPESWIYAMEFYGFKLIGMYDVDGDAELYRFELDESRRAGLPEGRTWKCHFQNVTLKKSNKAYTDKVNAHIEMMRRINK